VRPRPERSRILASVWRIGGKAQYVVLFRYGIVDGRSHSLQELSKAVKESRTGVQILQTKGLRRLAEILGCPEFWLHNRLSEIGGVDARAWTETRRRAKRANLQSYLDGTSGGEIQNHEL